MLTVAKQDVDKLKFYQRAALWLLAAAVMFLLLRIERAFAMVSQSSHRLDDAGWKSRAYVAAGWSSFWNAIHLILPALEALALVQFMRYLVDESYFQTRLLRSAVWIFVLDGVLAIVGAAESCFYSMRSIFGTSMASLPWLTKLLFAAEYPLDIAPAFGAALFSFLLAYLLYRGMQTVRQSRTGQLTGAEETLEAAMSRMLARIWIPDERRTAGVMAALTWIHRTWLTWYYPGARVLAWVICLAALVQIAATATLAASILIRANPAIAIVLALTIVGLNWLRRTWLVSHFPGVAGWVWLLILAALVQILDSVIGVPHLTITAASALIPKAIVLVGIAQVLRYLLQPDYKPGWCMQRLTPALYLLVGLSLISWVATATSNAIGVYVMHGAGVRTVTLAGSLYGSANKLPSVLIAALLYITLAWGVRTVLPQLGEGSLSKR